MVDRRGAPLAGIELTPDAPVAETVAHGAAAEAAGFDACFVSAHYNNRDPFALLARLAARTDEIALGPGIVNPLEIHPITLAGKVATVAEQSGGRALFGVGPGDPSTLGNLGLADERDLSTVLETVRVARRLWAGERVTHDGAFAAEDAGLNFAVPGPLPIYVGGEGPDMCRMAGKHADGLLYNGAHPAELAWARERVAEGLAERSAERGVEDRDVAGRDGGEGGQDAGHGDGLGAFAPRSAAAFDLAAYASVSVAEDGAAARRAARRPVAFIAAGAPEPVCRRHDIDTERTAAIGAAIARGEFGRADELVTDGMLDAFAIAGDPDRVTDGLAALLAHADGVVVGAPLGPDVEAAIPLAARALERAVDRAGA